jgi:hypothetical protein
VYLPYPPFYRTILYFSNKNLKIKLIQIKPHFHQQ